MEEQIDRIPIGNVIPISVYTGPISPWKSTVMPKTNITIPMPEGAAIPKDFKLTPQQEVANHFSTTLNEVEDFVILARTKKGIVRIYPCLDADIGVWSFVDALRAKATEEIVDKLFGDNGPDRRA